MSLFIGIIAFVVFAFLVFAEVSRTYGTASIGWLISLAIAIESLLAYGLLNAVADIAENMIHVGTYVKHLKSAEQGRLQEESQNLEL